MYNKSPQQTCLTVNHHACETHAPACRHAAELKRYVFRIKNGKAQSFLKHIWLHSDNILFWLSLYVLFHAEYGSMENRILHIRNRCGTIISFYRHWNLAQKKWGYYIFKSFLYILFISFPVGTLISYFSLRYIKRSNLINQFI